MTDSPQDSPTNVPVFSVGELSQAVKRTIEGTYERVRVRGEISGFKRHSSGHLYLSLKDDQAVLASVCWRGSAARLSIQPEDGMEVICVGRLTTYPGQSKYQLVIDQMELAGEGALLKLLEERKRKLAGEGLFDAERKRAIPYLPRIIGVVTSPTGAVIRDILHRLSDRFPRHVLVWPVAVQGETSAAQVAAAIHGFNALPEDGAVPRPDVLIVARGGGSLEDLWGFNEEIVVRAVADSAIPVISAVGHETDTTLIDFVADRRAPTPTAAAEMAVPVRAELELAVRNADLRLLQALSRGLADRRKYLDALARALIDPQSLLGTAAQRLDVATERLGNGITTYLRQRAADAAARAARLTHPRHLLVAKTRELTAQDRALDQAMATVLERQRGRQERLAARLRPQLVAAELRDGREKLGRAAADLDATLARRLRTASDRLEARGRLLESFSFKKVLERGFVVVRDAGERPITLASATEAGQAVALEFRDGKVSAVVGATAAKRPAPTTRPTKPMDQGSLL
ncbi:MAG: exodeoxyribonuclease VII large subunit [Alphaproteobacteria bacterium]|nr:exodeoxyribonuclease VII large subunit [Alphaproteobacteria bacterium]MBU0795883.1 exodeoxyribonuclease VII large subunit [Alphaproteobacteria bacterium]MBU0888581.1 exodeoxyribonuclease VII large subunit [Alphaproteobacteria bacterium]MBU1813685.1 exodeoxyribonuclease VII large subunit [Alphaproteobacteria bacterium]